MNETSQGLWLGKVSSDSVTLSLWVEERKVGSEVVGKDRSQILGRETIEKVRRGGRRASGKTKKRVHRFRFRYR